MHSVVETPPYLARAEKIFSPEVRDAIVARIAADPHSGDNVSGLRHIRKMRVAIDGRGQRGGARVIYFVADPDMPIFLILAYKKSDQNDLSPSQCRMLEEFGDAALARHRRKS